MPFLRLRRRPPRRRRELEDATFKVSGGRDEVDAPRWALEEPLEVSTSVSGGRGVLPGTAGDDEVELEDADGRPPVRIQGRGCIKRMRRARLSVWIASGSRGLRYRSRISNQSVHLPACPHIFICTVMLD